MTWRIAGGFLSLLTAIGCSDSHGGTFGAPSVGALTCGSSACGGDITGAWSYEGGCAEAELSPDLREMCPGATAVIEDVDFEGTVVFAAGGTGTQVATFSMTARLNIPASCLRGLTCAQLEQLFRGDDPPQPDDPVISCSGGGSCSCHTTYAGDVDETFTWTTSGDSLVLDGSESWSYCAQDNAAFMRMTDEQAEVTLLLSRQPG